MVSEIPVRGHHFVVLGAQSVNVNATSVNVNGTGDVVSRNAIECQAKSWVGCLWG